MKRFIALLIAIVLTLVSVAWAEAPETETPSEAEALPLAGVRIGIDPGHQEKGDSSQEAVSPGSKQTKAKVASGTRGRKTGIPEYVTVLEISFKLKEALEAAGAEVYMTRETHDVNISNQERAQMMNQLGVDLVLRIHCDGSSKKSVNGLGMYVNKSYEISAESKLAAGFLIQRMAETTGAKKRGVFERDTYTGLNWSTVPCVLVECGFMTNPDEDVKLNDPEYQQKLAEGMVLGIQDYIAARG